MITVIALTALVASFAISMNTEMRLARNADYDQEMEWMGRSGIELARFALANKSPEQRNIDALNQFWAGGTPWAATTSPPLSPSKTSAHGIGTVLRHHHRHGAEVGHQPAAGAMRGQPRNRKCCKRRSPLWE
jgi:hypothetical protein